MRYCKGRVTAVHHHSGCWEVVVEGEHAGTFPIDSLCLWPIVEAEGADWIGRHVEYRDGCMRFLHGSQAAQDEEHFSQDPLSSRGSSPLHAR